MGGWEGRRWTVSYVKTDEWRDSGIFRFRFREAQGAAESHEGRPKGSVVFERFSSIKVLG